MSRIFRSRFAAAAFVLFAALVTALAVSAQPAARNSITTADAWVRATPPRARVAAGYVNITNNGTRPDRLISVASPDAPVVEIHEMRKDGEVMRMRRVADGVAINPRSTVRLAPGGIHLMFIDPSRQFVAGETVRATLRFQSGAVREVTFEVRPVTTTTPEAE